MILTVTCSACSTSFPVDSRKVPAEGVHARCSACEEVFFVEAAMPVGAPAPPATLEEDAPSVASDSGDDGSTTEPDSVSGATAGLAQTDDWVFEVESDVDTSAPDMERLDTVEEGLRNAREESPWFSEPSSPPGGAASPPAEAPAPESVTEVPPPPPPPSPAPPPPQPAAPAAGVTFGRRDPHEKAYRLARVLVSDIITYNPERHQQALDGDTLKEDFEDEIQKSLAEYVEQVGSELADSTDYFDKALNEILARGQPIF